MEKMEKDGIVDPHILLVSADKGGNEMQRQVIPISEMRTYLRFTRAGEMRLYAWILDGGVGLAQRRYLRSYYTDKSYGDYDTSVLSWADECKPKLTHSIAGTNLTINVTIPNGVFGKEPAPWLKWFVNLWHEHVRVIDECHFRRRMIFAFTVKWVFVFAYALLYSVFRVAAASICVLVGEHPINIQWKNLQSFRPCIYW